MVDSRRDQARRAGSRSIVPKFGWHGKCLLLCSLLMLAMILAGIDETVEKRLILEKAARGFAKELGTTTSLPYKKGPCLMTGLC